MTSPSLQELAERIKQLECELATAKYAARLDAAYLVLALFALAFILFQTWESIWG